MSKVDDPDHTSDSFTVRVAGIAMMTVGRGVYAKCAEELAGILGLSKETTK